MEDNVKRKFKQLNSREDVANILEIEDKSLRYFLYCVKPDNMYKNFEINKRNGGTRIISAPNKKLKNIQRKLLQILENVYYPIIKNHVIYYQLDQDHESLYRYSLDDQTNQKLNDETSYDITIDGKYIYYLAKNDEQYALKRMTITGENIETLYEKQCTFALDNKDLYLTDNSQIIKINKKTLKQETIKKVENRAIALVNNKIVYATGTQLKMMSLNGKDDQILFKNIVVSDLQVLGSDLFTKGYVQESGVKYIVFNIKGQYKALNENTAQEFENLQDA